MNPRNRAPRSRRRPTGTGRFRVIGGRWRGRRLDFPALTGVRPTGDRVRETLFNWLQPVISGASCLDLFAGSGALGIEALSRGAAEVLFVDRQPDLVEAIRGHLESLGADRGRCFCGEAGSFLGGQGRPFDIIFLDPPFGGADWPALCRRLSSGGWLKPGARVYMEDSASSGLPSLPEDWTLLRTARAGNVGYHLASAPQRSPASAGDEE